MTTHRVLAARFIPWMLLAVAPAMATGRVVRRDGRVKETLRGGAQGAREGAPCALLHSCS